MTIAANPVWDTSLWDGPVPGEREPENAEEPEAVYGWCGLCHSFTDFPHECRGTDS
jgi:hypothetical protein